MGDIIMLAGLAVCVFFAVRALRKGKKGCGSCSGNCASCGGGCRL